MENENEQGSVGWLQDRLGKITASEMKNVLSAPTTAAYRNYKTQKVIEIMTGLVQESYNNATMQWGTDTEPVARLEYEMFTGNKVKTVGLIDHPTIAGIAASPDGLIGDDGLVEIKCPTSSTHLDVLLSCKAPSLYIPQMQGQMWVTGRQWCDFVSYDPRVPTNVQMFIVRVKRDDTFIAKLEKACVAFLEEVDKEVAQLLAYKLK